MGVGSRFCALLRRLCPSTLRGVPNDTRRGKQAPSHESESLKIDEAGCCRFYLVRFRPVC